MMTSRLLPPASSTYMLMSALLISVSSNRYADVSVADFPFLQQICGPLQLLSLSADCDDITADVIIADSRSCASSQLLISSTSEHCSFLLNCSSSILLQQTSQFLFQLVLLLVFLLVHLRL
ncbi:hypothetical protein F511_16494 [Dorcoceras hygrometricum]|uniref:Uncharacterized protein n=1 Tax=Dorcoceras hygrometricum TaxID=472368 RepID=A0A2Z7CA14_9LAMI|nr:hypothetical protein F511_16494 [Dorcoceras hygrometricum]